MKRVAFVATLAVFFVLACTNRQEHTFAAFPFDAADDCLETAQIIDVLDGPDPGACDVVRCWISPGEEIYVTDRACGGPGDFTEVTVARLGSPCGDAIAAYEKTGHSACPAGVGAGGAGGGSVDGF